METWLFSPPLVFLIIFSVVVLASHLLKTFSFKQGHTLKGSLEAYACGEADYTHMARPDYSTFFSYAFFFTLAHVATLVMTTVPAETASIFVIACIYLATVFVSLYILLRR
jgi:NADH-quinone oxidoreductase subunit A